MPYYYVAFGKKRKLTEDFYHVRRKNMQAWILVMEFFNQGFSDKA
jgi:hypothetical protein